jgi:NhaP-type Na+/H+ or K+/H+ antiporter
MRFDLWALLIGALLILLALTSTLLQRLPVSSAMLYLALGVLLGPAGWALLTPDVFTWGEVLERVTEVAVLISLFSVGLKLGLPLSHAGWQLPARLAVVSMLVTAGAITLLAWLGLGLSLGASVLLAAILAPTDPVLAAEIQVTEAKDRDRLRFSLTGEGALNDGAAFPLLVLGLGLLGVRELGDGLWRWLVLDVAWSFVGGLAIGGTMGTLVGRLVVHLRARHQESAGLDEFLSLGLVALAYGAAQLGHASGLLAVFAAGLALQRVNEASGATSVAPRDQGLTSKHANETAATNPDHASAYLHQQVQGFNEQLERVFEVGVVLLLGAMLAAVQLPAGAWWFVAALFLVVRPVAVWVGLLGADVPREQRWLMSWFGVRGVGSVFYLLYALNHGVPRALGEQLTGLALLVVALSIVVHGVSVTPLMALYARRKALRAHRAPS